MPFAPELFSAPALQRVLDKYRYERLRTMPFFDGLMTGEVDALVDSFSGEPEVHHPVRGRIKGEPAFRHYVADTAAWLAARNADVEHVNFVVTDSRAVEEVVVHLDGDGGRIGLPFAVACEHAEDARIIELRVYFSPWPLTGRHATARRCSSPTSTFTRPMSSSRISAPSRPATSTRSLRPSSRTAHCASRPVTPTSTGGPPSCARSMSGSSPTAAASRSSTAPSPTTAAPARWSTTWSAWARTARSPEAGLAVHVRGDSGRLAAVRVYDDARPARRRARRW